MRRLLLLAALTPALGCAQTPVAASTGLPQIAPDRYEKTMASGGIMRHYILRVPKAYDATKRLPLVVVLHGWTSSGAGVEAYSGMGDEAARRGYISVYPDGLGQARGWNAGFIDLSGQKKDDVAFVGELIDEVGKQVGVDPKRIYVCGHSNGAFLTNAVGAKYGDKIAAIGVVAGTIGLPKATTKPMIPSPAAPLSVIALHGRLDPMVAYGTTIQALLMGTGALESAQWWADKIGAKDPTTTDADDVETEIWHGPDGRDVELVSYAKGKHEWPDGGAKLLLDFFDAHPKR
ncbi:PHB depolymerase family esterase [soil metagenome]